jgi:cytochrome c biogenesis protein CcmG, thiol:disulfide interchange protein DsbE
MRNLGVPLEALLWLLVLGLVGYRLWPQVAAAFALRPMGEEAPAFVLETLEGEAVSLEQLRGQVVLVNFWATWCPPCRVEMPGFERVYRDRRADGFTIVGVSTDRGRRVVDEFVGARDLTFPIAMATGGIVADFGGVRALPTSFLIDRSGRVRHEVRGYFAEPALRLAVDRLLAEEPGGPEAGAR